ncbi:hypothetical protein [Burkholderia gladioli]|uniref:hypothetical protein n=1 Tax=Burkholderia gladioli TaxID=28095 RepID=UPI00163E1CBA|nr:hypothetical protein [Burkholderia gladioli]
MDIVKPEIALVGNHDARTALTDSYRQSTHALESIQAFFDAFTQHHWSTAAQRVFFRNWRSPGIGAASFCALTFRLLMEADTAVAPNTRALVYRSATRLSQVSHEDVGIGTTNHQQLYDDFARRISGDDEWKLDRYALAGAKPFLSTSRAYRQNGENLAHAITVSLPEELYNHGEFTFVAPRFARWRKDILGRPQEGWTDDLRFIHDHLGTTESGHFAALVLALEDYARAHAFTPDWTLLHQSNCDLIEDMAAHYVALDRRLRAEDAMEACAVA